MAAENYKEMEMDAREELGVFLNNYPHLKALQEEIDMLMEQIGDNPVDRATHLTCLMIEILNEELLPQLEILREKLPKANYIN